MSFDPLLDLARYQELEVQLDKLATARTTADEVNSVAQLEASVVKHRRLSQVIEQRLAAATKTLRAAELTLATSEEAKRNAEAKLYSGEVTNPKELRQLEARLSQVTAELASHEEAVLAGIEQVEELAAQQRKVISATEKVENALRVAQKRLAHRASEWDLQEQIYRDELTELQSKIRPDLLERYERLRGSTGGRPVAPLKHGVCGGCRTELPTAVRKRVGSDAIVTCERCSRILYWPE